MDLVLPGDSGGAASPAKISLSAGSGAVWAENPSCLLKGDSACLLAAALLVLVSCPAVLMSKENLVKEGREATGLDCDGSECLKVFSKLLFWLSTSLPVETGLENGTTELR